MGGRYLKKSFIYNDLYCFEAPARQVLVSLASIKRKMYPIYIGGLLPKNESESLKSFPASWLAPTAFSPKTAASLCAHGACVRASPAADHR